MASEKERRVVVEGTAKDYRQKVHIGPFHLVADEPVSMGGGDTGPGPYEYLLTALGTCTSMVVSMIARQRGWPVESIRITMRHDRIHAEDCMECETKRGMVDHIVREIEIEGDLTEEQRATLFSIAQRCPVSTTLMSEIRIEDHLVPAGA